MKQKDVNKVIGLIKNFDLGKFNKTKRIIIDLVMIIVGVLWIVYFYSLATSENKEFPATFISCVDGDTFKLEVNYKNETVRLLAIDTPEIGKVVDYYGEEASLYTCSLVTHANKIKVELDNNANKYDKYGRLLAWVYIDGELLQAELVENGYAKVAYLYDDYAYTKDIQKLEVIAKKNKVGLWKELIK